MDPDRTAGLPGDPYSLIRRADLCNLLHVNQRTISRWLSTGEFPQPDVRRGKRFLRWRRATIDAWLDRQSPARSSR